MFKRLPTRLSLIVILFGLTACATIPRGSIPIVDESVTSSITEKVSVGSMIAVPPGGGITDTHARVVDEYYSASGRHCVRVELTNSNGSTRVVCQREQGNWSFTRSLFNDEVPNVNEELLIKTPLNDAKSNPLKIPNIDQSSIADSLGTAFVNHYMQLAPYNGSDSWNFMGTSSAGPAKWSRLAVAGIPSLAELLGSAAIETPITGRR